jgi:hypothetical protein
MQKDITIEQWDKEATKKKSQQPDVFHFNFEKQSNTVSALNALKVVRERSRSVNIDGEEKNYQYKAKPMLDKILSISECEGEEEGKEKENSLQYSPSFSNSDMEYFSVDPPSPMLLSGVGNQDG